MHFTKLIHRTEPVINMFIMNDKRVRFYFLLGKIIEEQIKKRNNHLILYVFITLSIVFPRDAGESAT